jgi:glutamate dehydrogenase
MYFSLENVDTIANHILALYGAKIYAYTKDEQRDLDINLERETDDAAVYMHTSRPGVSQLNGPQHERRYFVGICDMSYDSLMILYANRN